MAERTIERGTGEAMVLRRLRSIGRRVLVLAGVRGAGLGAGVVLALCLAVAWLDVIVELAPGVRAGALAVGACALLATIAVVVRLGWKSARPQSVARTADDAAGTGGEILSGLDLVVAKASGQLTDGLRVIAVRRAGEVADKVAAREVAPVRPALKPLAAVMGGLACIALVALMAPRMARVEWIRTLTPWVDEPPYSPYEFTVTPGDTQVLYAGTVDVSVEFGKVKPEQLEMLVETEGAPGEVLPMFPEADGAWRGQLRELTAPVRYTVRTRDGRTRAFRVALIYTPEFEKVTFRVTPPAYTGLPALEGPLPEAGLAGLTGTKVEVTALSNRPLASGDMEVAWQGGETARIAMAPSPKEPRAVTGAFEIEAGGRFSIGLKDTSGLDSRTRMAGALALVDDKRPFVRIAHPMQYSYATPNAALPISIEADDDFGVRELKVFRSLNDSRDLPLDVTPQGAQMTEVQADLELPLGMYALAPGDVLTFYARVVDNDPASPKGAESEVAQVVIISQEDFDRLTASKANLEELLTKYYSQQRAIEALKERMDEDIRKLQELKPEDTAAAEELTKELAELAKALQEQSQSAAEAAGEKPLFEIDKTLAQQLGELATRLEEAAGKTQSASGNMPTPQALEDLKEARRMLGEAEEDYQKDAVQPLEALEKVYPLIEDQSRFTQLYLKQKDLARRMKSLADMGDMSTPEAKVRAADLADEQAQLADELKQLSEDIRAHASQMPEGARFEELARTAQEFAEALDNSGAQNEMDEAGKSLGEKEAKAAAEHAAKAEEILQGLLKECESGQGQATDTLRFQPGLGQGIEQTLQQLLEGAGLSGNNPMGQGRGVAGQGGYGMPGTSLGNVGLYGSTDREAASLGGGPRKADAQTVSISVRGERGAPEGLVTARDGAESGAGLLESVPPQYRAKVQEYFRDVAEEAARK